MRIKMLTRLADANRNIAPDEIVDMPITEAEALVNGGYAIYVDKPSQESKRKVGRRGAETAMVDGGERSE